MTEPTPTEILDRLKRIQSDQEFCKREIFGFISRFNQIESRLTSLELRLTALERQLLLMKQTGQDTPKADWERHFDSMQAHIDELIAYLEAKGKDKE